jgi:hypothetical protein
MVSQPAAEETVFTTSRLLEFFTEKELSMQIGHPRVLWGKALLKELIDNALDAAEGAGQPPVVRVRVDGGRLTVEDEGPGIPPEIVERSLDFAVRVSTKRWACSPNGWNTLAAARALPTRATRCVSRGPRRRNATSSWAGRRRRAGSASGSS